MVRPPLGLAGQAAGEVRVFQERLRRMVRMPAIAAAMATLPCEDAVIDGADGLTDFFDIHAALARKTAPQANLYAFDLLSLDGQDLHEHPLDERRLPLEDLLLRADEPPALLYSEPKAPRGWSRAKAG